VSAWQIALIVYVWMSALTLVLYGLDKWRARRAKPRIAEATLHWFAFLGGWPGAWLGSRVFRHKTRKASFVVVFWLIGLAHVVALCTWAWFAWRSRGE